MNDPTALVGPENDADGAEDERLLADLRRIATALDPTPPEMIASAQALFALRTLDAELAELTYDSSVDEGALASTRGTASAGRFFTFEAPSVTVEVETVTSGSRLRLIGELVPPRPGPVEVRHPGGSVTVVVDEMGRFLADDIPLGPLSLRCLGSGGEADLVVTDWVLV